MDSAITAEGFRIPLLLRLTPVMPVVGTNVLLSATSVDLFTYTWTTFVGFIPATVPYTYAAVVGEQVLSEWPPKDPVLLTTSVLGLAATLLVVWKLGRIASVELSRAGVGVATPTTASNGGAPRPGVEQKPQINPYRPPAQL